MTKLEECKEMIKIAMINKGESEELIARIDSITMLDEIYDLLQETEYMPLGLTYKRIDRIMA